MKKIIIIIASFLSTAILLHIIFNAFSIPAADISRTDIADTTLWHDTLNVIHNSYFSWRISPLIRIFTDLANTFIPLNSESGFVFALSIYITGLIAYLVEKTNGQLTYRILLAPLTGLSILLLYSLDTVVLYGISSFFWLLLFTEKQIKSTKLISPSSFGLALSLYFCLTTANQLSVMIIFTAYFTAVASAGREKNYSLLLLFITLSIYSLYYPVPHNPAYPQLSHVVPDDNLPGYIMPLYGSAPPIPYVHRQLFKDYFSLPALITMFTALLLFSTGYRHSARTRLLLIMSLFCVLETYCAEYISAISPVYTLNRVLPGAIYIPYLPLIFCLSLSLLTIEIFLSKRLFLPLLIVILALPFLNQLKTSPADYLSYTNKGITIPKAELINELNLKLKNAAISPEMYHTTRNKLVSPSYNVAYTAGINIFSHFNNKFSQLNIRKENIEFINASDNASHESLYQMFDDRLRSRWSPQSGTQQGKEWFELKLTEAKKINGIYMPCGNFSADFPRGIEILTSSDCISENGRLNGEFKTAYSAPVWEGNIAYTEDGMPYYDNQAEVSIIFKNPVTASCIRVRQTGKSNSYDWSVAELILIE